MAFEHVASLLQLLNSQNDINSHVACYSWTLHDSRNCIAVISYQIVVLHCCYELSDLY
jgi:hypothetical protein